MKERLLQPFAPSICTCTCILALLRVVVSISVEFGKCHAFGEGGCEALGADWQHSLEFMGWEDG